MSKADKVPLAFGTKISEICYCSREPATAKASNQNYVCHTWLNDDRLIVCSEAGDALLFDSGGEFKMVLHSSDVLDLVLNLVLILVGF